MRNVPLTLACLLLATSPSWADMGTMLPLTKWSHTTHRIETREPHPDYVFILCYEGREFDTAKGVGTFRDVQYVEIAPDNPLVFELSGSNELVDKTRRIERALLLAVPREAAKAYKTAAEVEKARDRIPVELLDVFSGQVAAPAWANDRMTVTHRLQRKQHGDGLEVVRTSRNPLQQWCAVAILFPVAVCLGGFWLARRLCKA